MDDSKKEAPLSGEMAKGAVPRSAENQALELSQKHARKAMNQPRFVSQNQVPIHVCGKAARTLQALVLAGSEGISARRCGPCTCRLAAYGHVLRHKHMLEIGMRRIETGRSWHGQYVLISPAAFTPR